MNESAGAKFTSEMQIAFEKWYRFTVGDDMDIQTSVAWDNWQDAWKACMESALVSDSIEEAEGSFRGLIESECPWVREPEPDNAQAGWWNTSLAIDGLGDVFKPGEDGFECIARALSYLDRRGLIVRKEGEPHLVRFVEG